MIEETLKCDILGRRATEAKPVRKVRVVVQMLLPKPPDMDLNRSDMSNSDEPGFCWILHHATATKDMCPDAIARANKFADRAANPPNIAATEAAEATPNVPKS